MSQRDDVRAERGAEGSAASTLQKWPTFELQYTVEQYDDDDRPDQCTIYPADAADEDVVTHWLTADEGGYVDVRALR